jgi:AmiR/NasT family two-component response regulator
MTGIIVVFPRIEDAKNIRNLLQRFGFEVVAVCTTGAGAILAADNLDSGIVVSGFRFPDMLYTGICDCLSPGIEFVLIASDGLLEESRESDIICLSMPIRAKDLIETVEMISANIARRIRREKAKPRIRSEKEKATISKAKIVLMERNHLTEEEAHKYMQKTSMDSGTNLLETAQMILSLMDNL